MPTRKELANAIRALSMDAVQQAKSGHPGMPMGMADIAEVLWNNFLRHNPSNPHWTNRDRFVLSNGHGSMLQYALLHLTGYDLSINDIKNFRQLHSKTPGHPERTLTPGVETTTGPLGQGLANSVGMAIAERALASQFNRPGHTLIDHMTYVFVGDGCLMEGISHEACSLAGTLKLGKLIVFWDDNGISIDGNVQPWFTDNTPERFAAYGWQVIPNINGHDSEAIKQAILAARAESERPSLICCKTIIGYGAPTLAGTAKCHGAPLGDAEIAAARQNLPWSYPPFVIPDTFYAAWNARERGKILEQNWQTEFDLYRRDYADLAQEFERRMQGELPNNWQQTVADLIKTACTQTSPIATRKASQQCISHYAQVLPEFIGGSADLTESNLTHWSTATLLTPENPGGNYISYGVREFGMSAIMNGIAVHGGFIPFGGTFLTFSDYARNAVRMAALMQERVIFVYTHDSIGLGEDGPTHQPIEHPSMLRLTPNVDVWRPCDLVESAIAWQMAIERKTGPSCLLFSRQALPPQLTDYQHAQQVERGGYILVGSLDQEPDLIIIATGSEVSLAIEAAKILQKQNLKVRVVSMPCTQIFDRQSDDYRAAILPPHITRRIAIEAAASDFWYKYVGLQGKVIGINQFGESAPAEALFQHFGFTVEQIINARV